MSKTSLLYIDRERKEVFVRGRRIHLSVGEYRTLVALESNANRLLSRGQLLEHIWEGDESFGRSPSTVDQHITHLRAKLTAAAGRSIQFIETVPRFGYRWAR